MKLSQITSKEIEALKGKCSDCNGDGNTNLHRTHYNLSNNEFRKQEFECSPDLCDCSVCKGTGQASIEIEKEYTNKIPKYKVGDEIEYCLTLKCIINVSEKLTPRLKECDIKLKIISETEGIWRMVMVKETLEEHDKHCGCGG